MSAQRGFARCGSAQRSPAPGEASVTSHWQDGGADRGHTGLDQSTAADRVARLVLAGLLLCVVAYINFRFVLVHFALGAELLDSGWYAWIFSSGDPWLTSPRSVSNLSYFNYHLTPYLSVVTLILHALPFDRFTAFARKPSRFPAKWRLKCRSR